MYDSGKKEFGNKKCICPYNDTNNNDIIIQTISFPFLKNQVETNSIGNMYTASGEIS